MPQIRPPKLENLANCPRCGENKWSLFTYFNPKLELGEGYRCGGCFTNWKEWFKLRLELIEAYNSRQTNMEEKE